MTTEADERLELLERNVRSYITALRETRPLAAASQAHADQMLTWAIGLMGAGLFTMITLLSTACHTGARPRLGWIAAPWVIGILCALAGRIVGALHRDADNFSFVRKWQVLETMLLNQPPFHEMAARFLDVLNDKDENLEKDKQKTKCLGRWTDIFYYATHSFFALGILLVFWAFLTC